MKSSINVDLPEDVIYFILLRLPVRTLLQFKSVCKHWYTLIGSEIFVKQHFGHENNQERLLVRHYQPDDNDEHFHAFALFFDDMLSGYEEPAHLQMPDTVEDLIGPVNGVFCVVGQYRKMALLNPAMRQFKPLLAPNLDVRSYPIAFDAHAFGLDPLSGDFKLVTIEYFQKEKMAAGHYHHLVSIYNSGSGSWRHFEDTSIHNPSHHACTSLCNTYLDGVYYWLMDLDTFTTAAILAFDMTTEKFQVIQVPDCTKLKSGNIALYGDSIALLVSEFDKKDGCIDIWLMQTERSWSRHSFVGPFGDSMRPIGFWKNNELLLDTTSFVFALCNIYTQKLRTIEAVNIEDNLFFGWVFSYKESLVSIKGDGGNYMLWDPASDFVKNFLEEYYPTS